MFWEEREGRVGTREGLKHETDKEKKHTRGNTDPLSPSCQYTHYVFHTDWHKCTIIHFILTFLKKNAFKKIEHDTWEFILIRHQKWHLNCHIQMHNATQNQQGYGWDIIKLVHPNLCNRNNSVLSQNQMQHEVNLVKEDIATSRQREQQRHHGFVSFQAGGGQKVHACML